MSQADPGSTVKRREDYRFLTGTGRYLDDVNMPRQAHAVFVRSPHAHAEITAIDAGEAQQQPGVIGIFTGADLEDAGICPIPPVATLNNRDGTPQATPGRPALAADRVRHVGDPVAVVVAETPSAAREAADLVIVEYAELPAVVSLEDAVNPDAAQIWPEAPGNLCLDWEVGDALATTRAFDAAAHVISLDITIPRMAANPIETRGAIAEYDPGTGRYTFHVSSQGVHAIQRVLARDVLKIPLHDLRVITPDVGGGFGTKIFIYPEYAALLYAAKQTGRPVKWISPRSESFVSDAPARDHQTHAELAVDAGGLILALRTKTQANMGAYLSSYGAYIPTSAGTSVITGLYDLPAVHCEIQCRFTNTIPVDAYRGAGKPEALFVLERLVDAAAQELGLSASEIRRRNLVAEAALPYTTALGYTFDSGQFAENLDAALTAADAQGLAARRDTAQSNGLRRGLGISAYFENTAGYQDEQARIHVTSDGQFAVFIGTQSNGQGHETTFAQIIARELQVPVDHIRLVQGDTDMAAHGNGTGGSRSLVQGGAAVKAASGKIAAKAKRIAAHLLEAAEGDIELEDGRYEIAGTDRSVTFQEIASAAYTPARLPPGMDPGLVEIGSGLPTECSFPNGFHLCEVEVDPATGRTELCRYTIVDDFGNLINPAIVEGQVHGGTVQGIGEALLELCVYEQGSGQLLTGSFMDYCMPRADDLSDIDVTFNGTPCLTNPLGVKGCGEAGAVAAPAAVINAIVDALAQDGVRHIDMPATPEKVWRAVQEAKR